MRVIVFFACLSLALARSQQESRIFGGDEAPPHSRPYLAVIYRFPESGNRNWYCHGTLVHPRWVISSAFCEGSGNDAYVGLGFHRLDDKGKQLIEGTWYPHPYYDGYLEDNDVALIRLKYPAILSDEVAPISIASADSDVEEGTDLLISGWGQTPDGYPGVLMQAVVQAIHRYDCMSMFNPYTITFNMICAASTGKDFCRNDQGGPLVSGFDETKHVQGVTLEGIASWSLFGCANPKYPGVYTRVSKYCSWFAALTGNEVTC